MMTLGATDCNKRSLVEGLRVDDGGVDVGEDLELIGDAEVVAVGGESVGDDAFANLLLAEGLDHLVVDCLLADPAVALNGHACGVLLSWGGRVGLDTAALRCETEGWPVLRRTSKSYGSTPALTIGG